jgi:hypothetical protein
MSYLYAIRPARAEPGAPAVAQEPTVGRWYCGVYLQYDGELYFGCLGRYEGEGVFVDESDDGFDDVNMGAYDYLQEQL